MNVLKGIRDILKIFIKICMVLALSVASFYVFNNVFYNKDLYDGSNFRALPENSMDIIVLGSSHSQYSFIPSLVYANNGLYSYVLGSACQPYEVSYQMLKQAFKTQSPKLVVMEVYTGLPLRSVCEDDSCYVMAEYQMTGEEKINTINYLDEEKAETYYFDYLNYHNNWRTVDSLSDLKPKFFNEKSIDGYFGYIYQPSFFQSTDNYWRPYNTNNIYDVELDETDTKYLNLILEYCRENGAELLLYKTPIDGLDDENISYLHKIWQWADENNVEYVDFIEEAHDLNFYMSIHTSSFHAYINGAGIITNRLAEEINNNNYEFNHTEYEVLNNEYEMNAQTIMVAYLNTENNPLTYMNLVKNSKGIFVLRYVTTRFALPTKFINDIKDMGIEEFDGNQNLYAVFKDGEVVSYSYNGIENFEIDGYTVSINSDEIILNDYAYNAGESCKLNYLYIDKYSGNIVDKYVNYQNGWFWNLNSFYYYRYWD